MEQLTRQPYEIPKLQLSTNETLWRGIYPDHLDLSFGALSFEDFKLVNYIHHDPIKGKLSTGLK